MVWFILSGESEGTEKPGGGSAEQNKDEEPADSMGELETVPAAEQLQLFVATGRTGRRNAMPEIADIQCLDPEAQRLAEKLSQLDTGSGPSTSGGSNGGHGEFTGVFKFQTYLF